MSRFINTELKSDSDSDSPKGAVIPKMWRIFRGYTSVDISLLLLSTINCYVSSYLYVSILQKFYLW